MKKKLLVALDEDLYNNLKKIRLYKGIPMTSIINNALRYTLKKTKDKLIFDIKEVLK